MGSQIATRNAGRKPARKIDYLDNSHLQHDLKRKAVRGATFTVAGQIANYVVHMISVVILGRLLRPEDFGIVAMVTAVSLLLQNFGVNGFTEVIIQQEELRQRQLSGFFWVNIGASTVIAALFAATAPLLARFYGEPRVFMITVLISVSIIFGGLSTHHLALLRRNLNFFRTAAIEAFAAFASVTTAVLLALVGVGYWALVGQTLMFPLMSAILAWSFCSWRPSLQVRGVKLGGMIKFALRTYGSYCLTYAGRNLDKVLLGRVLGSDTLGNYSKASQFTNMLPNMISIPLTNVAIATLSRLRNDVAKYRGYFTYVLGVTALVGMMASTVLAVTGSDLIILLLGAQWDQASAIFTAFAPSLGMVLLYNMNKWLHLSLGNAHKLLRWNIIALLLIVVSYSIGLRFGAMGVAIAYTSYHFVLTLPAFHYAGKSIGITAIHCLRVIWRYLLAGIISAFGALGLLTKMPGLSIFFADQSSAVRVLIGIIVSGSLYVAAVTVLFGGTKPFSDLFGLVREIRSRKTKTQEPGPTG